MSDRPIRLDFHYCIHPEDDRRVRALLSEDSIRLLTRTMANPEGRAPEQIKALQDLYESDQRLRKQTNARHMVAVFRVPTEADVSEILTSSRHFSEDGNSFPLLPEREMPARVRTLLIHVETASGKVVGGMEAIPHQMIAQLAERLGPYLYLDPETESFFVDAPTPSDSAAKRKETSRPSDSGTP